MDEALNRILYEAIKSLANGDISALAIIAKYIERNLMLVANRYYNN